MGRKPAGTQPDQSTRGGRLAAARMKHYRTATEAAVALTMPIPTYSSHENNNRGYDDLAPVYARHFGVSEAWLLEGDGELPEHTRLDTSATVNLTSNPRRLARNPLMTYLDLGRTASGYLPNAASKDEAFPLRKWSESDGYLCELEVQSDNAGGQRPRIVSLPGSGKELAVHNFLCLGSIPKGESYIASVKCEPDKSHPLFGEDDRFLFNPEDYEPKKNGLYILQIGSDLHVAGVEIARTASPLEKPTEVSVRFAPDLEPKIMKREDFVDYSLGRVIGILNVSVEHSSVYNALLP